MKAVRNVVEYAIGGLFGGPPQVGDLIEVNRIVYQHWAVYIGDGEVVHLTGDARSFSSSQQTEGKLWDKAEVKREQLEDVIDKTSARIERNPSPFTPQQIRKRALSKVGEVGYNLLFKNCEHFARWCRYNTEISYQLIPIPSPMQGAFS